MLVSDMLVGRDYTDDQGRKFRVLSIRKVWQEVGRFAREVHAEIRYAGQKGMTNACWHELDRVHSA